MLSGPSSELDDAADYFAQSLVIDREVQDRQGEGVVLSSLGQIALSRGRLDEAEHYFRECLAVMEEVQDALNEATIAVILGEFLITLRNNREEGCPLIQRAIQIRQDLELPGVEEAMETAQRFGSISST